MLVVVVPPTRDPVGNWGWAVWSAIIAVCALGGVFMLRRPEKITADTLLFWSYSALAVIAAITWLGGGTAYSELFLLSVLYTSATHPPRRVLPYLAVLACAASAPLVYEGWSRIVAADIFGRVLIWWGLAAVTMLFVSRVRSQRGLLRRAGDEASRLARVDALTSLGNRRAFDEALAASVARANRTGSPLTVIVADLDGFKAINDRFGHVAGDACLRAVADALTTNLRGTEACFRWGGDEFSIIVDGSRPSADALSERLAAAVAAECVDPDDNPITMRFGSASLSNGSGPSDLVTAADLDLIAAKAA